MAEPRKTCCWICGNINPACREAEVLVGNYIYRRNLCPLCREATAERIEREEASRLPGMASTRYEQLET